MSVAETSIRQRVPRNPQQQLTITSAIGGVILLGGFGFVFAALPMLWSMAWFGIWIETFGFEKNDFLSSALLILLELGVIGGLIYAAYYALQKQTQPGVRAGMIMWAIILFLTLWIGSWLGSLMDREFADNKP